jgi:hypothetical protein
MLIELKGLALRVKVNIEWQRETSDLRCALAAKTMAHRLTSHSTGAQISLPFIRETWMLDALNVRPVNPSVGRLRIMILNHAKFTLSQDG